MRAGSRRRPRPRRRARPRASLRLSGLAPRRSARSSVGCGPAARLRGVSPDSTHSVSPTGENATSTSTLCTDVGQRSTARPPRARGRAAPRSSSTTRLPSAVATASSLPSGDRSAATICARAELLAAARAARCAPGAAATTCRAADTSSARTTASTGARARRRERDDRAVAEIHAVDDLGAARRRELDDVERPTASPARGRRPARRPTSPASAPRAPPWRRRRSARRRRARPTPISPAPGASTAA